MSTLSIIMSIVLVIAVLLTVVYVMSLKTREDELHKAEDALQEDRRNLDSEMQKFKTDQETAWLKLSAKQHELEEREKRLGAIDEKVKKYHFSASIIVKDSEPEEKKTDKYIRKRLASAVGHKLVKNYTPNAIRVDGGTEYAIHLRVTYLLPDSSGCPVGEPGTPGITGPEGYPGPAGVKIE